MAKAAYRLIRTEQGWSVDHEGGDRSQNYLTKAAALNAAIDTLTQAMNDGHEVHLTVPGGAEGVADGQP